MNEQPDQPESHPAEVVDGTGATGSAGTDPHGVAPAGPGNSHTTAAIAGLGALYLAVMVDWSWAVLGGAILVMLLFPQLGNARMGIMAGVLGFIGVVHGWVWVVMVVALLGMIFLHELGHYVTARWSGMKATEFFLGFGPKLWSFTRGETEYGLKAIPAGAYVRIIGMTTAEEVPPEDEARTYRQQSFPKRLLVVSAGSLMHLALALVVALFLLIAMGVPGGSLIVEDPAAADDWVVAEVTPDSAADTAGIEPGDRVVAWDGTEVASFEEVVAEVDASEVGDEVTLTVLRDGEEFEASTEVVDRCEVRNDGFQGPFLGVGPRAGDVEEAEAAADREIERRGVVGGSVEAVEATGEVLWLTMQGVGRFATNLPDFLSQLYDRGDDAGTPCASDDDAAAAGGGDSNDREMMSIVGAVRIGSGLDARGLLTMFFLINLTIGLINMLPMLPLDGGHAAVAVYERLRTRAGQRYYADATKLIPFAYAGFMLLVMVGMTAMFLDIVDPVRL